MRRKPLITALGKKIHVIINFFIAFILIFLCISKAQDAAEEMRFDFVYRNWNNLSGLPQNTVFDVHKDQFGNVWGVTEEGIFRFDGSRFNVFNNQNTEGIGMNIFNAIVENEEFVFTAGYQYLAKIAKRVEKIWNLSPVI